MEQPAQGRFDLVPTNLAITAMRDNGYKNTAYALAELIDNSIQAGASRVDVLCSEREEQLTRRRRRRIDEIAVLDNGCGMDLTTLRMALQFGNGSRLDDRSGMGRFGMGLPNSSISQCRRVDVWTWQAGVDSAFHTSIDLDEIERGGDDQVPLPAARSVPSLWSSAVNFTSEQSGTLVIWSKLDKCAWKTAKAIIDNSEFLVGRMYRRFIAQGRTTIRMAAFLKGRPNVVSIDKTVEVNDPLYLTSPSSTPKPFENEAMFDPYGESWEYPHCFTIDGRTYEAVARFTVARPEARRLEGTDGGRLPHGKHAGRNVGVSIVRADREIELSLALVNPSDPRDRWWGVEVDFPPELDELFGVTNNKQSARTLSDLLNREVESMLEPGQTVQQLFDELSEAEDPQLELIRFAEQIRKVLASLRRQIHAQTRQTRKRHRDRDSAERRGTAATRELQEQGHHGVSDDAESLPTETRLQELQLGLQEAGVPQDVARQEASDAVHSGMKFQFTEAALDSPAFFSVQPRGGVILIALNTKHPVHEHLIEVLDPNESAGNGSLQNAREGLRLLLEAWARYEDEQPEGTRRDSCMDARNDWGRVARHFFSV